MSEIENRIPLKANQRIEVCGKEVIIDSFEGEGTSCLVYYGRVYEKDEFYERPVVVKEFYPELLDFDAISSMNMDALLQKANDGEDEYQNTLSRTWYIEEELEENCESCEYLAGGSDCQSKEIQRVGSKLRVSEKTKNSTWFQNRLSQFRESYEIQKRLAGSDVMEIMVRPYLYGSYGDSEYLLSDIHKGKTLEQMKALELSNILLITIQIAEMLEMLHEEGYLLMDFKPENLLWIERPTSVKLFDVDSILPFRPNELDMIRAIRFNNHYLPPEIALLQKRLLFSNGDITREKQLCLSVQINVYQLGIYLYELLLKELVDGSDLKSTDEIQEKLLSYYHNPEVVKDLTDILERSLSKRVSFRYSDMNEFKKALTSCKNRLISLDFMKEQEQKKVVAEKVKAPLPKVLTYKKIEELLGTKQFAILKIPEGYERIEEHALERVAERVISIYIPSTLIEIPKAEMQMLKELVYVKIHPENQRFRMAGYTMLDYKNHEIFMELPLEDDV